METGVATERIIGKHGNENIILNFLICSNHFHKISCKKPHCNINIFLSIVSDKLVRLGSADEKVQKFQKHCCFYYKEFTHQYIFLRNLAKKLKEKKWNQKKSQKKNSEKKLRV